MTGVAGVILLVLVYYLVMDLLILMLRIFPDFGDCDRVGGHYFGWFI